MGFPLQTERLFALVITGAGFTVTLTVCELPAQVPETETGVTVYTTIWLPAVVLVITSLITEEDCCVILSPVVFALLAAIQLKVDERLAVKVKFKATPLHTVAVVALVITGFGVTVTEYTTGVPLHKLLKRGVMV